MVYVSPKNWTIMAVDGRVPEEVLALYPDAKLVSAEQAIYEVESAIISSTGGVVRTTNALFEEAARGRSNGAWVNKGHTESFTMKDRLFGDVSRIYVRVGRQYFTLVERWTLDHFDILKLVTGLLLSERPAPLESLLPDDFVVIPRGYQGKLGFNHGPAIGRKLIFDATGMAFNVNSLCNWLAAHRSQRNSQHDPLLSTDESTASTFEVCA